MPRNLVRTKWPMQTIFNWMLYEEAGLSAPVLAFGVLENTGGGFNIKYHDPLDAYRIAEIDLSNATDHYYGFERIDGAWYIMKKTISGDLNTMRFTKGASGFPAGWTGKAGLSYDYLSVIFG